jgi:predicted dehydrogenase
MSRRTVTRRTFLMSSAAVLAGCATMGRKRAHYVPPNERLNIAAIGAGGKGKSDIMHCATENIVALCDVDDKQAGDMFQKFPDAKRYRDFRVMFDKEPGIDAVIISTPDHVHTIAALYAMNMGKHVYLQKPLTWSVYEARRLTETARNAGVATQMGNQGHSGDGVRQVCEMIWSGAIGPVREVHCWTNRPVWPQGIPEALPAEPVPDTLDWDLWIGPAPERPYNHGYAPFNWRGWWDFGCGALGDMGCHIMDPANWALKLANPTRVEVVREEGNNQQTGPNASVIRYEFPAREGMPPVTLYWYDGGNLPPRPEGIDPKETLGEGDNGTLFIGDDGFLTCGTYGGNARLLPESRMKEYRMPAEVIPRVRIGDEKLWGDIDFQHHQDWIRACKGGPKADSDFAYAGPFTEIVLLGNLALRTGQPVEWDSENMRAKNVDVSHLVRRAYRKGWEI